MQPSRPVFQITWGCLLTLWLTSLMLPALAATDRPQTLVHIARVVELDAATRTWAPGTVLSRMDSQVGVEVAGPITWAAESGTRVSTGDTIARIDSTLWTIALSDATAHQQGLEQRLKYLRSEADRLGRLAKVNSAARSALDESVANRDVAVEDLARARAAVQRNQHMLDRTQVRAPFSGQIVERLVDTGEYLSIGASVARLVDLTNLEVRAQAPLRVAPYVTNSALLPIRSDLGEFSAKVAAVIPVGNLESRSFEVRLALPNTNWVIGTPVQVGFPTASARRILALPRDALVLREGGPMVYRVNDGKVEQLQVTTGIGAGERIEITGDLLAVGDAVVVRGAELLRDGQPVTAAAE